MKKNNYLKVCLLLIVKAMVVSTSTLSAQVNIQNGTTITENFNGMNNPLTASASLPTGWKADRPAGIKIVSAYTLATLTTTEAIGGNDLTTTTNSVYNFGAGVATEAIDRAVGGVLGANNKSLNIYVQLTNNGATNISSFNIGYNVEKYRNGSANNGCSIQMYYSTDGTTWTNAGTNFLTSFAKDADALGFASAPGVTSNISNKMLVLTIAPTASLYLAWNMSPTSGVSATPSMALGIDDITISAVIPPTIDPTTAASDITTSSATTGGNIINDGGSTIIARGVCWSTTTAPTVALTTKTTETGTLGSFSSNITGLTGGTTYYVRAYATTTTGSGYGEEVSFTTLETPVNIALGTTITENFDAIGVSPTAIMPIGWKVSQSIGVKTIGNYSNAVNVTEIIGGNDLNTNVNGIYNFGSGIASSATDRSVGGLLGIDIKSANVLIQLKNIGTTPIGGFNIGYNVEQYKTGNQANGFSTRLYYSTDGITWQDAGTDFLTSFVTDGTNIGYVAAPGIVVNVSNKALGQTIPAGSSIYLAWNVSPTTGVQSGASPALGIDDISISAGQTPSVATTSVSSITMNSATCSTEVISDQGSAIKSRGICWNTSANPTIALATKTTEAGTTGLFNSNLTGLTAGSTYYVRAYATNAFGTSYGTEVSFSTVVTGLNLTKNNIFINVNKNTIKCSEVGTIEVFNLHGTRLLNVQNVNILKTNLSAGLYIVRFSNNGQQFIQKVTIQ